VGLASMSAVSGRKKIGLALGGGAARGLAHIGVLSVLEKEGIPIDLIAGTSIGSAVGSLYARLKSADYLKTAVVNMDLRQWAYLVDPALPHSGLIRGKRIINLLKSHLGGDIDFSDLNIPFACVATDVFTGEEIVINDGKVLEGIRASISIPAIFTVAKCQNRYLTDGGLVNPVPVSVVKQMGADFIIAVNVIPDLSDHRHRQTEEQLRKRKEPNILDTVLRSIYIATHALTRDSLKMADVGIEPHAGHIGMAEFHRASDLVYLGEIAAQDALPEIKMKLANL